MEVSPYLLFSGNCEAAFKFYEKTLGGKIESMIPHEGTPAGEQVPPEWRSKILHARMKIGDRVLMGSDAPPSRQEPAKGFSMSIELKDPAEAERLFSALAAGGRINMPLQETFWAARFGMLIDQFGIPWMVNCEQPEVRH